MDTVTARIVALVTLIFWILLVFNTRRARRKIRSGSRYSTEEKEVAMRKLLKRNMMAVWMFIFLLLLFTVLKGCIS